MSWNGTEDRRHHRRAAIRIRSQFGNPEAPTRIETVDMSAGGFSCIMDHHVEPLTKLALRFEFPSFADTPGRAVEGEAIVVRCEERTSAAPSWLLAAAFTGISEEDRTFLDRFVAWHQVVMSPSEKSKGDSKN
jgi:c-di-GMP-binding flagellar brake protein YcgR